MSAGWFTDEEKAQQQRDYNTVLVERYRAGLPLSKADRKEARRLLRETEKFAEDFYANNWPQT